MKHIVEMIAVDLDGTVFTKDHKTISKATYKTLADCIDKGIYLVPVTGRCRSIIPLEVFPKVQYAITCNGAYIEDIKNEKVLRAKYIPAWKLLKAWKIIQKHGAVMELFQGKYMIMEKEVCDNLEKYRPILPDFHVSYMETQKVVTVNSFDAFINNAPQHITKINFPGKCMEHQEKMRKELIALNLFDISSDGLNMELTQKGCNKGEALLWLAEYLKISSERVCAFGDGDNDISMLRSVKWGVAMGNALEKVKSAAPYLTVSNEEDGISLFINKYFMS